MSELFFDLVRQVEHSGKFEEILKNQQIKYQLQPFKIDGIDCQNIRNTYESLQERSLNPAESVLDANNWNENERRVFIWFIIFYTYFKDISSNDITPQEWNSFSTTFFNKNPKFLHFQLLNMIKPTQKISWTEEEDQRLMEEVQGEQNWRWNEVAKSLFYNSNCNIFKTPKHCRERWLNHLDNKKKHGLWTPQEDLRIFKFVLQFGKKWCKLVPVLKDTRTEHMIKNRYNSLLNKQRKSKKEREEQLCMGIIKQLKKQVLNLENKKRAEEQKVPKIEYLPPEEKPLSDNNTNEKELKSDGPFSLQNIQNNIEQEESGVNRGNIQYYPFTQMQFSSQNQYYPVLSQQQYGYTYIQQTLPCVYPLIPSLGSLYWM